MEQVRAFRVRRKPLSVQVHAQGQGPQSLSLELWGAGWVKYSILGLYGRDKDRGGAVQGLGACVWESVNACERIV